MKFVVWFLGLLAIVVVAIFGIVLFRNILRGYRTANPINATTVSVADQDLTQTTVEYVVQGPVVADEDFRSISFVINDSTRVASVMQGYQNNVMNQQNLTNNLPAFTDFAQALDNAGFGRERERRTATEASGRCASGKFYIMKITVNGQTKSDLWSDSCFGTKSGTFGGNRSSVNTLFQLQFPDYNQLVQNMGGRF